MFDNNKRRAEDLKKVLAKFLSDINYSPDIEVVPADDEGSWFLKIAEGFCEVEVGWPVELKTLGDPKTIPGYRVYYWKEHPGGRWNPPEQEDVTYFEGLSILGAAKAVAKMFAEQMIDDAFGEVFGPEEI